MHKSQTQQKHNNFNWLLKNSFSYIWESKNILLLGSLLLVLWVLLVFLFPILVSTLDSWYNATSWFVFLAPVYFLMIGVFGSIIGEHTAIYSETNYILTKNIGRRKFLFAKCLIASLSTLIFAVVLFLCLIIVLLALFIENKKLSDMFGHGRDWYGFITSALIISFFSCSLSVLTKYCFRQWTYMLVTLLIVILYAVLFPMLVDLNNNSTSGTTNRHIFITWAPICFIFINIILYFTLQNIFERRLIQV